MTMVQLAECCEISECEIYNIEYGNTIPRGVIAFRVVSCLDIKNEDYKTYTDIITSLPVKQG